MSWIESGIKEFEEWEERVLSALAAFFPPDKISYYLDEYKRDNLGLFERAKIGEGLFNPGTFGAIASISQIRSLLEEIKQPLPEKVPLDLAARFAVLTFRAGFTTGMTSPGIGMVVLESEIHRLQNQQQYIAKTAIRESSENAHNARYAPLREFKENAASVAKRAWEGGSNLFHHQMVKYLVEEYQDENGKHPFTQLPDKNKSTPEKVLLKTLKEVAKEINRPDLISGQKKSS